MKRRHGPLSIGLSVQAGKTDPKVKAHANVIANIIVILVLFGMVAIYLLFNH